LKFTFNENNLSINFTIVDFEDENYVFAYKLRSTDNWTPVGSQRNLLLADLPAGRYDISLRATGKSGAIKTAQLSFIIRPPFWRSAWFITLAGLLMAGLIYYIYRRRIHLIRQRAELDKEVARIEMKALHTQMNPHFIFNCLNSIKKMILDNENGKASRYLSKFAQLIRITLNQSTKSFISLKSTIDYLERYLEMEQTRTDQFTYTIEVDEDLNPEDIYIPPMLIQPFIENAIWHGSPGTDAKTQIHLDFSRQGEDLVCMISDNGVGIDSSLKNKKDTVGHNSLGIANVRQRMQVLNEKYNLHARLTIEDRSQLPGSRETGTLVTLLLSIKTTDV
jgi:LytS/YehU family sensor histidine kinase